ncbi:ParA family protein [Candidatus Cyanaurora vandensis]|uniref:ParA family protein n=1 Tax=Candidatus Cyanaurora vandensis TaxID=2714958 RepID=UPI002580D055|nr:ParA family protein [Candidatus Cyanaurora vandensis]
MQVVTVLALAGGMGRTTTAVQLGLLLAERSRVLVVDLDPQASATTGLGGPLSVTAPSVLEVLMGTVSIQEALREVGSGLWVVGADRGLGLELNGLPPYQQELLLQHKLKLVAHDFDYVVVDTMSAKTVLTVMACCAADTLVIPMDVTPKGLVAVVETLAFLTELREVGLQVGELLGVLPMREVWIGQRQPRAVQEILRQVDDLGVTKLAGVREFLGVKMALGATLLGENSLWPYRDIVRRLNSHG